jgi:hypothetical protein
MDVLIKHKRIPGLLRAVLPPRLLHAPDLTP